LLTLERLIALDGFLSWIFCLSQFAFGFCSSPLAASPSCCSYHHCSVLCPLLPLIRITIPARSPKLLRTPLLFQQRENPQSFAAWQGAGIFSPFGNRCRWTANHRRGLAGVILSSGARRPIEYCASNARSASATVGPIPAMPSSTLDPSSAIQRSPRTNNWGRRTADGLSGWAAQ
jgi:hypothetical protein